MPFSLLAIVGSATYSLSAGTPFRLISAEGLGMAPIRRLTETRPFVDGDTDLGYRLDPRFVTLTLSYAGSSGSVVDGYRNTLAQIFRPTIGTPVQLRVIREDGGTRQLDCYTVGQMDVPLDFNDQAGRLQRAVVQLKASDPTWYSPTQSTATKTGYTDISTTWQLGGGAIGTAQVMESGTAPGTSQAWTYTSSTRDASVAIRTARGTAGSAYSIAGVGIDLFAISGGSLYGLGPAGTVGSAFMPTSGTHNFVASLSDDQYVMTRNGSVYYTKTEYLATIGSGVWRTGWSPQLPRYAVYAPSLSSAQVRALDFTMAGSAGVLDVFMPPILAVPYSGNVPEYPVIQLRGPISSPTITNTVNGAFLSFGTFSIASNVTYTIDLRFGRKSVLQGTTSRLDRLSEDSNLADFALQPSPIAPGGTNVLTLSGSGFDGNTRLIVTYYNRYAEY